ncbi:DUF535 family protein [Rhodanobacter sp. 7MK24]|nr:DUF535 family protein [Rhodanobacter sp. 7MK24]
MNEMQHTLPAMSLSERAAAWLGDEVLPPAIGHFLRSLRGRHDWHGKVDRRTLMAAKYIARCLAVFRQQLGFLAFVESEPALRAFRRRDPRMLERHLHRYLNTGWRRSQRLRAIRGHYRHALAAMPTPLFRAVYAEGAAPLGLLTLKDGGRLILSLRPPIFLGCEGELCIQLADELGNPLYRIVVTVIDDDTLAIGCIQGPVGGAARETVRELTRNLHGLRPRCLMLALTRALARHWGLSRLLAVGNAAHPLRNPRRRFVADYDAYWEEQQGRAAGGGWYELPLQPLRKAEADVPSQHRSAFRKREALRMEAERLLVEALGAIPGRHQRHTRHVEMPGFDRRLEGACAEAS